MTYIGHALAQEPLSHVSWNLQFFVEPSLVFITTYSGLSDLCLGVQKKIFKETLWLYGHAPAQEPCPRGHGIYDLVDPSLVITTYLVCLIFAWE